MVTLEGNLRLIQRTLCEDSHVPEESLHFLHPYLQQPQLHEQSDPRKQFFFYSS